MIIGNPFVFAIRFDVVDSWNIQDNWINGMYEIYIYEECYSNCIYVTELTINLKYLFSGFVFNMNPVSKDEYYCIVNGKADFEYLKSENKIINIESSDMLDDGVEILFFFNDDVDFILVNKNKLFEFKSRDVYKVFKDMSKINYDKLINLLSYIK